MRYLWISGAALLLDQFSKWLVMETMALGTSIPVLGSVFKLTYIHNPGAVFGLRLGGHYVHLGLAGVALVLVLVLLLRLPRGEWLACIGLALVLGGAVGNVIDRLRFGVVIDFLDFGVGGFRWWVFNLADSWVTVGAGLLLLSYGVFQKTGAETHGDDDPSPA